MAARGAADLQGGNGKGGGGGVAAAAGKGGWRVWRRGQQAQRALDVQANPVLDAQTLLAAGPNQTLAPVEVQGTLTAEDKTEIFEATRANCNVRQRGKGAPRTLTVAGTMGADLRAAQTLALERCAMREGEWHGRGQVAAAPNPGQFGLAHHERLVQTHGLEQRRIFVEQTWGHDYHGFTPDEWTDWYANWQPADDPGDDAADAPASAAAGPAPSMSGKGRSCAAAWLEPAPSEPDEEEEEDDPAAAGPAPLTTAAVLSGFINTFSVAADPDAAAVVAADPDDEEVEEEQWENDGSDEDFTSSEDEVVNKTFGVAAVPDPAAVPPPPPRWAPPADLALPPPPPPPVPVPAAAPVAFGSQCSQTQPALAAAVPAEPAPPAPPGPAPSASAAADRAARGPSPPPPPPPGRPPMENAYGLNPPDATAERDLPLVEGEDDLFDPSWGVMSRALHHAFQMLRNHDRQVTTEGTIHVRAVGLYCPPYAHVQGQVADPLTLLHDLIPHLPSCASYAFDCREMEEPTCGDSLTVKHCGMKRQALQDRADYDGTFMARCFDWLVNRILARCRPGAEVSLVLFCNTGRHKSGSMAWYVMQSLFTLGVAHVDFAWLSGVHIRGNGCGRWGIDYHCAECLVNCHWKRNLEVLARELLVDALMRRFRVERIIV